MTWGANLHNWTTKALQGLLRRFERNLAHKEKVAARHEPGTPYHTRATREIEGLQERIEIIEAELRSR